MAKEEDKNKNKPGENETPSNDGGGQTQTPLPAPESGATGDSGKTVEKKDVIEVEKSVLQQVLDKQ